MCKAEKKHWVGLGGRNDEWRDGLNRGLTRIKGLRGFKTDFLVRLPQTVNRIADVSDFP